MIGRASVIIAWVLLGAIGEAFACGNLPVASTGTVRTVLDGRTLVLVDGRTVRLSGVEVPQAHPLAREAAVALEKLITAKELSVRGAAPATDRHGRVPAVVSMPSQGLEGSVQRDMLALGLARVMARSEDDRACLAGWLSAERLARDSRQGLWADPDYMIRRADDPASVGAMRGRFALVEGEVRSVRESGGTIYVNFGRRWTEDFTVTIAKRNERIFTAAGLRPKSLERRQVRVRGYVEERGGPWIDATSPAQIEVLDRK